MLLITAIASAAPACVAGSYQSYEALGAGGCQEGNLLFSNFVHIPTGGVDHPDSSITVTPLSNGFTFGFTGPAQTQTAGFYSQFSLYYTVTDLAGALITGANEGLRGTTSNSGGANIDLLKQFCLGAGWSTAQTPTCGGTFNALDSLQSNIPQNPADKSNTWREGNQTTIGVHDAFQINGGAPPPDTAFATLSSATNTFNIAGVPEPGTFALLGLGLLGIATVGRKAIKH